ncbi:hypothetical protein KSC_029250 [Ktedonobacter sp. SOSP1-52]|nr:hypothetical protein KSC_029250 [Ktedonobacter sp. SOSP1-52]
MCEHLPFEQVEECLSILGTMLDDWTFQSEPLWLPSRSDDGLCLAFLELIKAYEGYKVFVHLGLNYVKSSSSRSPMYFLSLFTRRRWSIM